MYHKSSLFNLSHPYSPELPTVNTYFYSVLQTAINTDCKTSLLSMYNKALVNSF